MFLAVQYITDCTFANREVNRAGHPACNNVSHPIPTVLSAVYRVLPTPWPISRSSPHQLRMIDLDCPDISRSHSQTSLVDSAVHAALQCCTVPLNHPLAFTPWTPGCHSRGINRYIPTVPPISKTRGTVTQAPVTNGRALREHDITVDLLHQSQLTDPSNSPLQATVDPPPDTISEFVA